MSFWFSWPRFGYKCALIAIPVAGRAEQGERARAGTWLNGFVGSFHGTQLHKCQLWGLKLVPQHVGWEERGGQDRGGSSNVATLYAVCCACCCVSVGVCFYYTRSTCSTSVSLSLSLSSLSFSLLVVCSLACPRASKGEILVGVS